MGVNSAIEWTTHTFNPWWGCTRVSPGCAHCYAETFANRFGVKWGKGSPRRPSSEKVWAQPIAWNKAAEKVGERARVFCASMADWADDEAPEGARERLFTLIRATPWLDWQLLTKRPENILGYLPSDWGPGYRNVWIGTTVENQAMADKRIRILLQVPALVRFLSCEPMLGPVSLRWLSAWPGNPRGAALSPFSNTDEYDAARKLHWVICGGESGRGARPMDPKWAYDLRDQCHVAGIPFFMKQMNKIDPIPADLLVRQFPAVA